MYGQASTFFRWFSFYSFLVWAERVKAFRRFLYIVMAKEFSEAFYKSPHWKKTRANYFQYCHGYCELCMQDGIFSRAEIIHHKIELTPDNITDPNISLSFDNLQALCRECHMKVHGNRHKRFKIDELGRVTAR